MHLEAIKILRAAIDENLLTLSKLDYGSSQADSVMALIDGLKYSIKLLR